MNKSVARQYLLETKYIVLRLFDYRCVIGNCGKPTGVVHEIVPISHGKQYLAVKNRVPLCQAHHSWAHDGGTNNSIPILLEERRKFLTRKWEMRCQRQLENPIGENYIRIKIANT